MKYTTMLCRRLSLTAGALRAHASVRFEFASQTLGCVGFGAKPQERGKRKRPERSGESRGVRTLERGGDFPLCVEKRFTRTAG
jgi:hypothetical protein